MPISWQVPLGTSAGHAVPPSQNQIPPTRLTHRQVELPYLHAVLVVQLVAELGSEAGQALSHHQVPAHVQ